MDTRRTIDEMPLDGGHLALDFANTTGGLRDMPPAPEDEMLESYADLVTWCERAGVADAGAAARLRQAAAQDPRAARRVLRRALELRVIVHAAFRAIADGAAPDPATLAALRDAERRALARAKLAPGGVAMRWTWPAPEALDDVLDPVAHAAVDLLTRGPLDRVKGCANCRWVFLDQSRNRSRRWCSMDGCGTQIKHRRFVERRRRGAARVS